MAAFLVRSYLSRGDLKLYLSNWNGYAQDAASVRYTIFSNDGSKVSGTKLTAIKRRTGEYYIPWITDVANGNYRIEWEIQEDWGSSYVKKTDFFFVVDPSAYPYGQISPLGVPTPGQFTFLTGQGLGPGDLPLYLKNNSGFLQNAFAVFFTIFDVAGCPIVGRSAAGQVGVGTYFAPWYVNVGSGDYVIQWEFQQDLNSPLESVRTGFSVVCPAAPFVLVEPVLWTLSCGSYSLPACYSPPVIYARAVIGHCDPGPPCFFNNSCAPCPPAPCPAPSPMPPFPGPSGCCFEIPRIIHLGTGYLPPSGGFTNQPYYVIPQCVRKVAFYVTYARSAIGGFAVVRLMWGDGVTESQETLLDLSTFINEPISSQNMYLQEMNGPTPADGNPISFIVEGIVPGGTKTVRLIAAEKGKPGAPGTIGITLTASTD